MNIKRMWTHWLMLAFALLLLLLLMLWPVSAPDGLLGGADAFERRHCEPTCWQRPPPADQMHAEVLTS